MIGTFLLNEDPVGVVPLDRDGCLVISLLFLLADGGRIFNFNFGAPSVAPDVLPSFILMPLSVLISF